MTSITDYPMLSERSRGWLKYLHRKVNTAPDVWDCGGHPSPMWDDKSSRVCSGELWGERLTGDNGFEGGQQRHALFSEGGEIPAQARERIGTAV